MKISLALLVLLLAAAWTGSQGFFHSSRSNCCEKVSPWKNFLESKIQDYQYTPSSCNHKAVRLTLQRGLICVDPEDEGFKEYLKKQKKSNSTST